MEEEVSAKLMDECGVVPQEWSVEEPEDTTENKTEDLHDVNEAREDQELQENDISMVNAESLSRLQKEDPSLRNCREQAYKTPECIENIPKGFYWEKDILHRNGRQPITLSTVGIPKTILTNQGSNFTSELLKQLNEFLKDYITGERSVNKSVTEHVVNIWERLAEMTSLVKSNLERQRSFSAGDEVLILLPSDTKKMAAQWKGLFRVVERFNDVNFKVNIRGRRGIVT
ncbi:unnamed protein product [Mytilus coruscus]|uniref:Integrase catalytic domain-containing protein n=1 Tax=Mytilus coruscus TaxID=42192 RepID=A0A6J7ZTP2_MYTCO|nr:unnamed protein product [Mytilus coruscus]